MFPTKFYFKKKPWPRTLSNVFFNFLLKFKLNPTYFKDQFKIYKLFKEQKYSYFVHALSPFVDFWKFAEFWVLLMIKKLVLCILHIYLG